MKYIEEAKKNFLLKESTLCEYATKSTDAIRLNDESSDMRPAFFRDIDNRTTTCIK